MDIKAFNAFRFNNAVVGDAGDCISPPYDVIDADQQDDLYARNEHNVVRIIKGKQLDGDADSNNVYTRAATYFNNWVESGALKADAKPGIYAYVQDFNAVSESFTRSGFIALGKLAEFGSGVQPHEKTLDGPKADRLNLMRATAAQFGQIFMLFDDEQMVADKIIAKVAAGEALVNFTDEENVTHKLYVIDDTDDIHAISAMMAHKQPVIADGHHRYETALNYFKETGNPDAAYRMMTFVNMRNEGLVVLPTHRLVKDLSAFDMGLLVTALKDQFKVEEFSFTGIDDKSDAREMMFTKMRDAFKAGENAFGLYGKDGSFYFVELKDKSTMDQECSDLSPASRALDVCVLHRLILDNVLGIGEAQMAAESNLEYIKDIGNAIDRSVSRVDDGSAQAVFYMNPTPVSQVQGVADAGEKMPQKSTFFYPKIFTGLTINKL